MARAFGWFVLALLLASCASAPSARPGTGFTGYVLVGPTCPVERLNSPCPPHPLSATIIIRDGQGSEVARVQSGTDGHFKVDLLPGTYTLIGLDVNNSALPRPIPTTATVTRGSYTQVTVEYDSGIR